MERVTLEETIQQALKLMEHLGISKSNLISYKNHYFRLIQKYYDVSSETLFNTDLLDCYQKHQENRLQRGIIGSNYYTILIRAVKILLEVYQTGTLRWRVYGPGPEFKVRFIFSMLCRHILKYFAPKLRNQEAH